MVLRSTSAQQHWRSASLWRAFLHCGIYLQSPVFLPPLEGFDYSLLTRSQLKRAPAFTEPPSGHCYMGDSVITSLRHCGPGVSPLIWWEVMARSTGALQHVCCINALKEAELNYFV